MDFSPIGKELSTAFTAIGNVLIAIGGSIAFISVVIIGIQFLLAWLDRRIIGNVKSQIGWTLVGGVFLASAGLMGKVFATAIAKGTM